jgi:beta-lactamase regulating signal transducer with metallopeptidase domain
VLALLALWLGQTLAPHRAVWTVPGQLALPLVELGRARLGAPGGTEAGVLHAVAALWALGVALVLAPLVRGWLALRARARRARPASGARWTRALSEARRASGVHRPVRLLLSSGAAVPVTWGLVRPIVLLPAAAERWSAEHRRAALLHELAHVRSLDAPFAVLARVACALYWFHPAAWWIARGLHDECERASDDRVISLGVRRSAYAELLLAAADALATGNGDHATASLALARRAGLRDRLARIVDGCRTPRPVSAGWARLAAAAVLASAAPAATIELSPTRAVLERLMHDARWESRAYAVVGLAERPDSLHVARAAALHDPSPRVRAWAEYALARRERR